MTFDFPLCADSVRGEKARSIVERSVSFIVSEIGPEHLEAIVLAGSLARGEGSVLLRPSGLRLLGDAEFLVVLRSPFDWDAARREMVKLSQHASRDIGEDGCLAVIEYQPAGLMYFRRNVQPSIFAYDLLHHGKVIWGRSDILSEMRSFGAEAIPQEDAVELIMNRIVEMLLFEAPSVSNGQDREALAYHLVKIILDLAGSAQAFLGRHVALYQQRQEAFMSLLDSLPDLRAALPNPGGFQEELVWATHCKLAPTDELLFSKELPARIAAVAGWAKGLWLWQMRRLLGRPGASFEELLEGYLAHEPILIRLRGWAKLYLHPLRPKGSISPVKLARFFLRASPQSLTYAAALLAYWGRTGQNGGDWIARADSLLPARSSADGEGATIAAIADLWRWLIRNN